MPNSLSKLYLITALVMMGCSSSRDRSQTLSPLDKHWTLEATPNRHDKVGVVFAIKNRRQERIPGGTLELQTDSSIIVVGQNSKRKDVSFAAILNFIGIKNVSPSSSFSISDSTHIDATFTMNNGILHVINDNISVAFEKKRDLITSNVKSLGLQDAKLYVILETIQAPELSITFSRATKDLAAFFGELNKTIGVNSRLSVGSSQTGSIVYKLGQPLTVFYKLRELKVDKIRGDEFTLTLGSPVQMSELIYERNQ